MATHLAAVINGEDVVKDAEALMKASGGLGADIFLDFQPEVATAKASSHLRAAVKALRICGRLIVMGGVEGEISLPYLGLLVRNVEVRGRFMYEPDAPPKLIRMIERGLLSLHRLQTKTFPLTGIKKALDAAMESEANEKGVALLCNPPVKSWDR